MIEEIKKIIFKNEEDIKISKFFHGNPATSTKVLFFVSYKNKPFCIIKMVRDLEWNDLIEREINGIRYFNSLELKTPKILSFGQVNSLNYVCQELIQGQSVGKREEKNIFPLVAKYHNLVNKGKIIKINLILDAIKDLNIKNDREYEQVISLLNERKNNDIYIANQHGDLTYKNIIKDKDSIVFIDFENFGLRSFWGSDITHYLTRMTNVYDLYKKSKIVSETMFLFVGMTKKYRDEYDLGISDEQCADLFLLDLLFEDLQKTYSPTRKEIISIMKNIWLK